MERALSEAVEEACASRRLALVSGGSRGLGAALCTAYAERGWGVVELSRSAPSAFSVAVDFGAGEAAVQTMAGVFAAIAAAPHDEIVVIANAALLGPIGPLEDLAPVGIERHFAVGLVGQVLLARAFVAACVDLAAVKTLAVVSSGAAQRGYAGWSLYCAAKAALEGFVRALAEEQTERRWPIVPLIIDPGPMATAMQAEIRAASAVGFPARERFVELHAHGALGDPAVVAERVIEALAARPPAGSRLSVRD